MLQVKKFVILVLVVVVVVPFDACNMHKVSYFNKKNNIDIWI